MARDLSNGVLALCLLAVLTVVGIAARTLAPAGRSTCALWLASVGCTAPDGRRGS